MPFRKLLTLGIFLLLVFLANAQPGDPTEEDPDNAIPLGRTEILLTAGVLLGIRKILLLKKVA